MPRFSKYGNLDDPPVRDGDSRFFRWNARLRPSQLQEGEVAWSQNGRMDIDGAWKPRDGYENKSGVLISTNEVPITYDADSNAALVLVVDNGSSTAAISSNVCTVTCGAAHGLPTGHTSLVNLTGFTAAGSGEDINGNRTVTRTGTDTFQFALTSADDSYTGGTVSSFKLDAVASAVYGSCNFSDPTDAAAEYILIATNSEVRAYDVATFTETVIAYPASEEISAPCHLEQVFDRVLLFREGSTAWEWDGDLSGSPAFAAVPSGTKTQQTILQDTNNTTISDGLATVNNPSQAHGLEAGDRFYAIEADGLEVDPEERIVVASKTSDYIFTYYVDAADITTTVVYSTGGSDVGGGFINMPAVGWGTYHQRRLWLPYTHDGESSPASRDILDELIASDILDYETYDPVGNQFRITGGVADYLVAVHPFNDDVLIALNRNSIHVLKGVSGSLADVETQEMTREIGCSARRSVVTHGSDIFFMSDAGIYSVGFLDEYNLRGIELPLSEAIEPVIQRINKDALDKVVGVYHDNRLMWAVPLDGSTTNNALLVYNLLNKGWESVDTTNAINWSIQNLIPARAGKKNELYGVAETGGIHKLEATDRDQDLLALTIGDSEATEVAIPAYVDLRQYDCDTMDRKKFHELELHLLSDENHDSEGTISLIFEDPDNNLELTTIGDGWGEILRAGESASLRKRMGNSRAYGVQIRFTPTDGLPALRMSRVDASVSFRSNTSAQ